MICKTCREAGDLAVAIRQAPHAEDVESAMIRIVETGPRGVVKDLHTRCKGESWCDCQHVINFEKVETINV